MNVVAHVVVIGWVCSLTWFAGMLAAFMVGEWRERRSIIREFEAILTIAEQVRETSPPLTSEWLAECVSQACEKSKGMGL